MELTSGQQLASRQHRTWFQRPHTVTVLCLSLLGMWIASVSFAASETTVKGNLTRGVMAATVMFLVFATLQLPDGILVRPCRAFWRFLKGCSVLYLMLVMFLLFQDLDDIRAGLAYLDPSAGVPLPERNYADNCELTIENLSSQIDEFVVAHFFGWLIKALVIRDATLLWFLSILFELMEISLRHILPNFWECWWDHLILDVFGCNLLGIVIGVRMCKWFNMKEYNWQAPSPTASARMNGSAGGIRGVSIMRVIKRLQPKMLIQYRWPSFLSNLRTFVALLVFTLCVTLLDLNAFFLKSELYLQPTHIINKIRLAFWACAAAAATREFYDYIIDEQIEQMGLQCWLSLALVLSEVLLAVKWHKGLPRHDPMPDYVYYSWIAALILILVIGIYLYFNPSPLPDQDRPKVGDVGCRIPGMQSRLREDLTPHDGAPCSGDKSSNSTFRKRI